MKTLVFFFMAIAVALNLHSQTASCGNVFNDTFDDAGAIPSEWTEYITTGSVTVVDGDMKLELNSNTPSVFRTFTPVTNNTSCSFDIQGSRTTMNCQLDLMSSDGKYIASIALGKATTDIKYSTEMVSSIPGSFIAGVIGDAKFAKNAFYSLTMYVDFDNQTVDFYNAGELTLENIPFLESTNDLAKVNIQLLYMYGNTGTVLFDNLNLVETDETRMELVNALEVAELSFKQASIGSGFQQYPQIAANEFQQVITDVQAIVNDCSASSTDLSSAIATLSDAETVFLSSQLNPVALRLYSVYAFSGEEKAMTCGYYNGTLGSYDDRAVSFKLDSGYMATFAQDINGAGFSKVYIASEGDLEINLPAELQRSISFIRVGPWRNTRKKGSSGKSSNNDVTLALESSWFYDWGNADATIDDCEYVVMNWAGGTNASKMKAMGETMDITHHLAFNEPDGAKQANMTVDKAIEQYAILQASGLRLGSPAVTDGAKGRAWLDEFMPKAIAAGYRIDFIPVHYYKIQDAVGFVAWLKDFYDEYQIPIWVTEFNYGDIWAANEKIKTEAQVLSNIKAYCELMDETDFIERYCIFTWQPSETSSQTVMSVRSPVTLNSVGEFYANHVSTIAYQQEEYIQGPDLGYTSAEPLYNSGLSINVYPNPIDGDVINIQYLGALQSVDAFVRLYDVSGKEVLSQANSPQQIDVAYLNSGIYMMCVETVTGSHMQKVIINH